MSVHFALHWLHFVVLLSSSTEDTVTITTKLGSVKGNVLKYPNTTIYEFLGIPYAIPPLGKRRFTLSEESTQNYNGTLDATTYGHPCVQFPVIESLDKYIYSEDCLVLNIWTSNLPNETTKELQPVMFWIHGGGFVYGSADDPLYNGTRFLEKGGSSIVYVGINYRLGPLGFLSSSELYSENNGTSYGGMNGIQDQLTALEWVKHNIISFGGNPDNITIFGESAGGLSVCTLIVTPYFNNYKIQSYYNRAIVQSGACVGPWTSLSLEDGINQTINGLESVGFENNITYLRGLNAFDFTYKLEAINDGWVPSVDMYILTDVPEVMYNSITNPSDLNVESIIWGVNSQDGVASWPYFDGGHPDTIPQYKSDLQLYTQNETITNTLYNTYYNPSNFLNVSVAWYQLNSDVCLMCPTLNLIKLINDKTNNAMTNNQFMYYFRSANYPFLATHGSEMIFEFYYFEAAYYFSVVFNGKLANEMISSWNNFGRFGVPNVSLEIELEWIPFGMNSEENVIVFDNNTRIINGFGNSYRQNVCSYWNSVKEEIRTNFCLNEKTPQKSINKI